MVPLYGTLLQSFRAWCATSHTWGSASLRPRLNIERTFGAHRRAYQNLGEGQLSRSIDGLPE